MVYICGGSVVHVATAKFNALPLNDHMAHVYMRYYRIPSYTVYCVYGVGEKNGLHLDYNKRMSLCSGFLAYYLYMYATT